MDMKAVSLLCTLLLLIGVIVGVRVWENTGWRPTATEICRCLEPEEWAMCKRLALAGFTIESPTSVVEMNEDFEQIHSEESWQ